MRKIYSLVLMATMLLIGTNAWADGVIEIVRGGVVQGTTYDHLKDAFAAAQDGDILQLTDNMNESVTKAAWFGEPTSGTLENYASTDRSVTLDLKGHLYNFTGDAGYKIVLTRGVLRIKSTGGEGEITSNKSGITVYGTYLKVNAKENTPFAHLIIEENVKITCEEKGVMINSPLRPESTSDWGWDKADYPVNYCCEIFKDAQYGISNGARIDIHGKVYAKKYACQVSGNIRTPREYLNADGSYNTAMGAFPYYQENVATGELYLPGTTKTGKTKFTSGASWKSTGGTWWSDSEFSSSNDLVLTLDDNDYAAYVHIHKSAVLKTNNEDKKTAVGFYSAGYSRVYIEGTCEGSTGLYVKSGDVELHDATITSNYSGDYAAAVATSTGVVAGGSGIVIESNKGYTGNIDATVTGDTYVKGSTGYAIDEAVTNAEGSEVDAITITGGTFVGGGEGTMKLSETTVTEAEDPNDQTTISIVGGAVANGQTTITVGENEVQLTDFLADIQNTNTHITYVTDENNKTTMIISEGPAPAEDPGNPGNTTWAFIASQSNSANPPSYAWTAVEQNQQISSGTIYLGELQINSGSAGNLQELIIHDGATLQVERLIMNAYARIIVEAGGKLIVKGTQGISAPSVENIKLEASETAQALFLFHPEVSSNRHPNATVEFISNSYVDAPNYAAQRFGIPTHGKLTGISAKRNNTDVETAFAYLNYAADEWTIFGYINSDKGTLDLENMKSAFGFYQMVNNTPNKGTVVTMTGELYGNLDPTLPIIANKWNGYANSYMAPIDAKKLMSMIPSSVDKSFHVYEVDAEGDGEWVAVSNLELHDVRPLQAFLLRNTHDEANVTINYAQAVYAPMVPSYTPGAPARHIENNMTMATLIVKGEMSKDRVVIAEDAQFSAEFDNGYDAAKYMNDGINLYVSADEKMAHFATDNLENTYLGFQAVNGGKYTLEFANVQGEELTLIDLENNASVVMVDGNKYEFTADANSKNDYRFKIVSTFNAPTAIENTEATKNAKGIYTITGQYVGEMNVWNSLPAGIYVVNGDKRVK